MRRTKGLGRRSRLGVAVAGVVTVVAAGSVAIPSVSGVPAPPTLRASFDDVGITQPGHIAKGDLDGAGDSFSSTGLAADGLKPGTPLLHDGLRLRWPHVAPGRVDNVVADGQTIAVSGHGSTLGIVAAAAYGPVTGTVEVGYTDGTTSSSAVTFADWVATAPASGTDLLATGPADGTGASVVSLSYATVPLTAAKVVSSVTLPTVGATIAGGTTSLHVFDLTVGTPGAEAAGAPGSASYYDEARKDCVGTAADTASKTWYTVADGTLSDVYDPTIDNTDVKSLDPIVTGTGFAALQPRDMTYRVVDLGGTGMACRIVATDTAEHFAVVTDYVTDPRTDAVVMQESLVRLPGAPSGLHVYLRFNPLLNGHAGGGTANSGGESATVVQTRRGPVPLSYSTNSYTEATNRTYATPIYAAMAAGTRFAKVETGFAGAASDGLSELDASQQLTTSAPDADNGNVVQTVELSFPRPATTSAGIPAGGVGAYAGHASTGSAALSCATAAVTTTAKGRAGRAGASTLPTSGERAILPAGIAASVGTAGVSAADVSSVTVALGFAGDGSGATAAALKASATPFGVTFGRYQDQWIAYDRGLCAPPAALPAASRSVSGRAERAYWVSADVLKASEDKSFLGDTAASLASPWGQAVPAGVPASDGLAPYYGSYREVFPRDAYETFTGFLTDGDLGTARQMVKFFFDRLQLRSGGFPRNGLLNGKAAPDTGGMQLDETADPILAAWQAGLGSDTALWKRHIEPAADFLAANGPSQGVERWEEQTGFSPSTIADEIAGLVAASAIAREHGATAAARLYAATADDDRRVVLASTVTTNGPLSAKAYFIRVDKTGDPNEASDYTLGNGDPTSYDQRAVVDQGFLELSRTGAVSLADAADATLFDDSLAVTAKTIDVSTPSGTGVMRYNGDGYGDCEAGTPTGDPCTPTGAPWAATDTGTGHPWPVLSGENAEYQILTDHRSAAVSDLSFMLKSASGDGLVPEQVWDGPDVAASPYGTDPETASIGFVDGRPDGSAAPLTWAEAQELRLIRDMGTGRLLEQAPIVAARYRTPPGEAPLSVTAPATVTGGNVPADLTRPSTTVDAASTTFTGTTSAHARVEIADTSQAPGVTTPTTTITSRTAGSTGAFSIKVALGSGTNSIEVTTTAVAVARRAAATDEAVLSIDDLYVPGTTVLQAPASASGGNGPGTYAYPTATNSDGSAVFAPDSFRLNGLTVIKGRSTVTFQVGIANLQPTFGSLFGAQLLDLYIHAPSGQVPTGEQQSTAAAGAWNYSITPADAWNQLIEVDGFGTDDWVTPGSATAGVSGSTSVGTPQVSFAQLDPSGGETPGVASITVPTSALGDIGPGWTVTVTLAGQNGEGGNDDARTFAATPQGYIFGVCSAAEAGGDPAPPICSVDPSTVPIVLDTIAPSSVTVQTELNPVDNPAGVTLEGVTVPAAG